MGVRIHVGKAETIGHALRRFRKWVNHHSRFEKWWTQSKRRGAYVKPSAIRYHKELMRKIRAAQDEKLRQYNLADEPKDEYGAAP